MVKVICEQCGKEFEVQPWEIERGRRFCSRICYGQWCSEGRRGRAHPTWSRVKCVCDHCGKEFEAKRKEAENRRFCSRACADLGRRKRIIKVCKQCGKEFEERLSRAERNSGFCSRQCRHKYSKVIKICKQCGKKFEIYRSQAEAGEGIFCSKKCMGQWQSENVRGRNHPQWGGPRVGICERCGKEFEVRWPSELKGRRYCSRECFAELLSETKSTQNSPLYKQGQVIVECEWCGKKFKVRRSAVEMENRRFCSHGCALQWRSEEYRGKKHWNWKGMVKRTCEQCGVEFEVYPSRIEWGAAKFCSGDCYHKWYSENMVGENSPHWKGGKSFEPYGVEFNERLREYIRERDGRICAICKMPERGQALAVHHIDYDKQNSDPSNLIALCHGCHIATNSNRPYWQEILSPLPLVHSEMEFRVGARCLP